MKFSIITVVLNKDEGLKRTIESILSQNCDEYELIIIDGESEVETLDVISSYKEQIKVLVSEPDEGIYDAMNKGIRHAQGEWLFFLNAGDSFYEKSTLSDFPDVNHSVDVVYGSAQYVSGATVISEFSYKTLMHNTVHHQAAFYNKRLFKEFMYDKSFKIFGDYDLNLKIYMDNKVRYKLEKIISLCEDGGLSQNLTSELIEEMDLVRQKHLAGFRGYFFQVLYHLKLLAHKLLKS